MRVKVVAASIGYTDEDGRYARLVRGQIVDVDDVLRPIVERNPAAFEVLDAQAPEPETTQAQKPRTTQAKRGRRKRE